MEIQDISCKAVCPGKGINDMAEDVSANLVSGKLDLPTFLPFLPDKCMEDQDGVKHKHR